MRSAFLLLIEFRRVDFGMGKAPRRGLWDSFKRDSGKVVVFLKFDRDGFGSGLMRNNHDGFANSKFIFESVGMDDKLLDGPGR